MRKYGWRKQISDIRDLAFKPVTRAAALPAKVDLRPGCPPVVDQGQLGSCTANAIAAAHEFAQIKQSEKSFPPSRLFIYYNERDMEGTVKSDAGAEIRDGFKSIAQKGVCPEPAWKYDITKFAKKPTQHCYAMAAVHKAVTYLVVDQSLDAMRGCLADGFPFVFGFTVYESFENVGANGLVPMPKKGEQALGGHAVCAVGYDDKKKRFTVRNSWGSSWADGGYCYMPYSFLTRGDLASDFWTIRLVA